MASRRYGIGIVGRLRSAYFSHKERGFYKFMRTPIRRLTISFFCLPGWIYPQRLDYAPHVGNPSGAWYL